MDPREALAALVATGDSGRLVHTEHFPATPGVRARGFQLGDTQQAWLSALEIPELWAHQADALQELRNGNDVIVTTGTSSGKSLTYQLRTLELMEQKGAAALYLFPTKALAHDQASTIRRAKARGIRLGVYDGDTPTEERTWIRQRANLIITNPDMLHAGILPNHPRWSGTFRNLGLVVIDEAHLYRGVFGSQVSAVIRRLRRICARYGSDPAFVLASATIGAAADHAEALVGRRPIEIDTDSSAHGERLVACWQTSVLDEDNSDARRSLIAETSGLLAVLASRNERTIAFTRSRRAAEVVAASAQDALKRLNSDATIAAYRAGYLPEERRELERGLSSGELQGVAATTALELGIDVGGLDAVIVSGFPGTKAAFRQQIGRAGRAGRDSLAILIADEDPLDQYLVEHPDELFDASNERTVLDPSNISILAPQLLCAAHELPLTSEDEALFGDGFGQAVAIHLERGWLTQRGKKFAFAGRGSPHEAVQLRGQGRPVQIVEESTGRLLGSASFGQALRTLHAGAIYLHQGEQLEISKLDLESDIAFVERAKVDWYTISKSVSEVEIVEVLDSSTSLGLPVKFGRLRLSEQVVSYARKRIGSNQLLGEHALELPVSVMETRGLWYTLSNEIFGAASVGPPDLPGAIHAAEHAQIALMPLLSMCDRWDIGGLSTPLHPDTGQATIFVYDGYENGAGFARRSFDNFKKHLRATLEVVDRCACASGCPSCVQSPKCGNGNEPLDKYAAVRLLQAILDS